MSGGQFCEREGGLRIVGRERRYFAKQRPKTRLSPTNKKQQYRLFESRKKPVLFHKKKRTDSMSIKSVLLSKLDVGNELSSQEVALQVFSPLRVFTTVFGMGTGGLLLLGHQQACVWLSCLLAF